MDFCSRLAVVVIFHVLYLVSQTQVDGTSDYGILSLQQILPLNIDTLDEVYKPFDDRYKRICFVDRASFTRPGRGRYKPSFLTGILCTHLVYAFATISIENGEIVPFNENVAEEEGFYRQLVDLKRYTPRLKVMISIGGWAVGSLPFHMMASDQNKILHFTRSVGGFLNKYGFDGVDINWCYPGSLGSPYTDRLKYIELMSALYINFWANEAMGNEKRILSATVPAGRWIIDRGFDIEALRNWVDFINIMAYDYHGSWEYSPTGIHNALNPRTKDPAQEFNAKWTVEYYIKNGFDPVNINLGIPLYGRTFHLANDFQFGVGAPSTGAGPKFGPYSRASGMLGFNEICPMLLEETGYTLIWHEEHQVPYFYNRQTGEWVSFECPISSARKALYVEERGLGGLMFFSIDSGDFDGTFCNFGIQPIVVSTIIISYYNKSMAFIEHLYNFTRHSSYDETDDLRPPCDFSDHGFTCSPDPNGIYPHPCPYQCDKWIHCSHNIPYIKDCPLGQYFINETRRCDWPWLTQCPRSFT